ncbi:MAG: outer membrane beta-barrel protein [Verrucomicrobiota bacterium]
MKIGNLIVLIIFSLTSFLLRAEEKDIKKTIEEGPYVETAQTGITLSGYVDAGYTYNFVGRGSTINNRAYNDDANNRGDFNLHAVKLVLEKPLSDANELQAGFRADLFFGEDAGNLGTNNGAANQSDSISLQQGYIQFRLPYANGIDFAVGKFASLLGYECVERPVNMNITLGNVAAIDPSWYTGVRVNYEWCENLEAIFAVGNCNGLDNGPGLDNINDEIVLTGALNMISTEEDRANLQIGFHYAPDGDSGYALENETVLIGNLLGNWKPKFANDKLCLGFNASLATFNDFSNPVAAPTDDSSAFFGVALYGKYQFTDLFSVAQRLEYAHTDDDQYLALGGVGITSNDLWGYTITSGFDFTEECLLRAEYRIDWGDDLVATTGADSSGPAHTAALEAVYSF